MLGASKLRQLADNLGAAEGDAHRGGRRGARGCDRAGPVYPNWFIDEMADGETRDALRTER